MASGMRLDDYLASGVGHDAATTEAIATTVRAIAAAGRGIAALLAQGRLIGDPAAIRGGTTGAPQKEADLRADAMLMQALRDCPVACVASEEQDAATGLHAGAPLAVAVDPLNGSSNIDTAGPVGTIFSILSARPGPPEESLLRPGSEQHAAGFLIYGARTALVLTRGDGTHIFRLDPASGAFVAAAAPARVPLAASEYAINASNQRHWEPAVRRYVAECIEGRAGPRGRDFNTRWQGALVGEAFRILLRGGVYLYPRDSRAACADGWLRLLYEANPIAWIIEQAGGAATDGQRRILDLLPTAIHQRVPLVLGAIEEVTLIGSYHAGMDAPSTEPLFATRSLFRSHAAHRGVPA